MVPRDELFRAVLRAAVGHGEGERIAPVGGTQNSAPHAQDVAGEQTERQLLAIDRALQQAEGAVADAEHAPTVSIDRPLHDGADDRVEPGAVTAAGQNPEALDLGHVPTPVPAPAT